MDSHLYAAVADSPPSRRRDDYDADANNAAYKNSLESSLSAFLSHSAPLLATSLLVITSIAVGSWHTSTGRARDRASTKPLDDCTLHVIASEAKQSPILELRLLRRCAPRNDMSVIRPRLCVCPDRSRPQCGSGARDMLYSSRLQSKVMLWLHATHCPLCLPSWLLVICVLAQRPGEPICRRAFAIRPCRPGRRCIGRGSTD